jgi:hypothetical protein
MGNDCVKNEREKIDYTRQHDLTVAELRQYPIFADFTDKQTEEVIATIKQFTRIVYDFCQKMPKPL